jgi:LuxR family transcriptional regulator, maltose regulon positive regulatory protein
VRTRLVVPPLHPEWVGRPGQLARLDEIRRPGKRLALLSAPAGYGKTALAATWASSLAAQSWAVVWISLTERERDVARFLQVLAAALDGWGVEPDEPQPPPSGVRDIPTLEQRLAPVLNQLDAALEGERPDAVEGLALVLDDVHLAESPRVSEAIALMLAALPQRMRMVATTRVDPPWALARMRARGELVELRAADLRFSAEEISLLLAHAGVGNLPSAALSTLEARTEGWPAALQLAALSLRGRPDAAALVVDLGMTRRHLLDFLLEEVVARQPAIIQRFLLATSLLEVLAAPLCEELVGLLDAIQVPSEPQDPPAGPGRDAAAAEILDYLEMANLFLVPMDETRQWYRYHRLFRDLLANRLERCAADVKPELHRRSSAWYEREGLIAEAVDHAFAARELGRVAALLLAHGEALLMRGETETLLGWLAALPDATFAEHPLLHIWYAAALLFSGQPAEWVERHLSRAADGAPSALVSGAVDVFAAMLALLNGDPACSAAQARRGLSRLPGGGGFVRWLGESNLGMAQIVTGDLDGAVVTYERLLAEPAQHVPVAMAIGPLANLGGLAMIRGELRRAQALYGRVLEIGRDPQGRLLTTAGKALMGLGEVERERDELDAATGHLEEGIALTGGGIAMGAVVGYVSLMLVRQAQGDAEGARIAIANAHEVARRSRVTDLDDHFVTCYEVWLRVLQGQWDAVRRWVERDAPALLEMQGSPQVAEFRELMQVVQARAHLGLGEPEAALRVLASLEGAVVRRLRMRRAMEIWVLQSLALAQLGRAEAALRSLMQALTFGEPEGFVRVFLDGGPPVGRLLYHAIERDIAASYAGRLLARFTVPDSSRGLPAQRGLVEALSERELEVLALIARGLTNAEIAAELVIALTTVKGHTTNIYGKLGVHTRTQAVARARALGLLTTM